MDCDAVRQPLVAAFSAEERSPQRVNPPPRIPELNVVMPVLGAECAARGLGVVAEGVGDGVGPRPLSSGQNESSLFR
jgi:hypothetical protein